jgi:hypothetical protein
MGRISFFVLSCTSHEKGNKGQYGTRQLTEFNISTRLYSKTAHILKHNTISFKLYSKVFYVPFQCHPSISMINKCQGNHDTICTRIISLIMCQSSLLNTLNIATISYENSRVDLNFLCCALLCFTTLCLFCFSLSKIKRKFNI